MSIEAHGSLSSMKGNLGNLFTLTIEIDSRYQSNLCYKDKPQANNEAIGAIRAYFGNTGGLDFVYLCLSYGETCQFPAKKQLILLSSTNVTGKSESPESRRWENQGQG